MTITSVVAITGNLPGDGSNFTFDFSPQKIFTDSDLRVYHVIPATGVETLLTEGTGSSDYSVSSITFPGTGSITYPADEGTPIPSTEEIVIKRVIPKDQQTAINNQDGWFPTTHEQQYDRFVAMILDLQEQLDRCIKLPITEDGFTSVEVNPGALRTAGHYLRINSTAKGISSSGLSSGTDATASDDTPADVNVSAGAAGSGTDFSREDHAHKLPTTVPRLATENIYTESQIWKKGSDATAASPLVLGAGNIFDVAGNTAITSITSIGIGTIILLEFDGTPTLTHHSTNLILPGGQDIVMQAGDIVMLYEYASADWRLISHFHGTATNGRLPGPDYESSETSLNNDAQLTFAHGLGRTPSKVEVILRANTSTAQGWANNEEGGFPLNWHGAVADDAVDVTWDGTNVYITQGANIQLLDHTTFNEETITQTEYDWVVRGWA